MFSLSCILFIRHTKLCQMRSSEWVRKNPFDVWHDLC